MKPTWSHNRISLAAVILLLVAVRAQAAPDDVELAPAAQNANNFINRGFVMDDNQFDANVFQPSGNAKQARTQIETKLKLQMDELNRICSLDDLQKQKLKLAGTSDMKRFFDEVDVLRKKFKESKHDQNAWQNIWQEIHPLQTRMQAGLFGETSFFSKTIRKTLTPEQLVKYEEITKERRRFRYRASIEVVITNMEDTIALRHAQHEAIVKMLIEETQPPASFGQYDQYVVMYHLGRLPEGKLKALLDDRQWQLLQGQINSHRGMEQMLIQNGVLPKEEAEVKVLRAKVKRLLAPKAEAPVDAAVPENQPVDPLTVQPK